MKKITNLKYSKLLLSNTGFLEGAKYFKALEALQYARQHHNGKRKDGSREFSHQLIIGLYIRSISGLILFPEQTLATVYLHDVSEDYNVPHAEIESLFGSQIANATNLLNKNRTGKTMSKKAYYTPIGTCPIASLVKGADRVHNFQSMVGVFTREKQIEYMREARRYILPMLKQAFKKFPKQYMAYDNLRHTLKMQIELISVINNTPSRI